MAKTITGDSLKKLVEEGIVIENGTIENCGSLKYDFVLSEEFLKSDFKSPKKMSDLTAYEKREAVINPGEVVYVLTKEKINIPNDMYMHLSANRGMSEYGVLTLGGFAVDPGYSGKLMFGLYNYSSTPFTLIPGEKLVGAIFYRFDEEEARSIKEIKAPKSINRFPPRLVSIIDKYSPVGLSSLEDSIKAIKEQMEVLRQDLNKNKDELYDLRRLVQDTQEQTNKMSRSINEMSDTVTNLSNSVKELKGTVRELTSNIDKEIKLRSGMSEELDKKLEIMSREVNKKIIFIKGAAWASTALISILITLLVTWAGGWLSFK
jgi:deoxycytidine triphosphate deaminase/uncharacterized protein YoxC